MSRTKKRPLPAGRMDPQVALVFGLITVAISVPPITFGVNALTGMCGVVAFIGYVMFYTLMKQRTTMAIIVAENVIRSLRRHVRTLRKSGAISKSEKLWGHVRYFERRMPQLNYHQGRCKGLPIGSGITEGTCKSLVAQRAKRGGQRWRPQGLSAVLSIRALR
ncbi:MAG: UbiA family prenyltransferase, partial [Myxococcales bacterium]|nr:UbiA family prenyltransferase [Myxococcales bacterium]